VIASASCQQALKFEKVMRTALNQRRVNPGSGEFPGGSILDELESK